MIKLLPISMVTLFLISSCSTTKEIVSEAIQVPEIVQSKPTGILPIESVLSSFEHDGLEFEIMHCFGNPETRELTIDYRLKNWGTGKNFVVTAEGNSATINGKLHDQNCVTINGLEECSTGAYHKLSAKTDITWKGKCVFKNVKEFDTGTIEQLTLQYKYKQLNGEKYFAEFKDVPIVWDALYKVNQAKKIPNRLVDDNNGLTMEINKAVLNETTRELSISYTVKNLDANARKVHVNARGNEMIYEDKIHTQSCAGIDGEMECGLHFVKERRLISGE